MKDLGFFLGLFAIIVIFALSTADGTGIFSPTATSTPHAATGGQAPSTPQYERPRAEQSYVAENPPQKLTPEQVERKVADIYRELDRLTKEVRALTLRSPASPYANLVRFSQGNARDDAPEREYLMLQAQSSNREPLNISNWYFESYVTGERAALPQGDRSIERWRYPQLNDIQLLPGETAYVLTGKSPIKASFHENICTGYLANEHTFYPSLQRSCPRPLDEMIRFGNIALDNDACYAYVERIGTCTVPDGDDFGERGLSSGCRRFIERTLNHDDCVAKHRFDPFFDNVGYWRIYLERRDNLWRREREIIRLIDENDRVVAVIEY